MRTPTLLLLLTALGALALPASPALALCPSYPDTAGSRYVENSTAQTLCLQRQLSHTTDRLQLEGRLDALRAGMAAELQRQQLMNTPVPNFVPAPAAAW